MNLSVVPLPCYCNDFDVDVNVRCAKCWLREIPEIVHDVWIPLSKDDKTKLDEIITKVYEEKEIKPMKKTKAMLEEELEQKRAEIDALKIELEKAEKYKQYEDAAGEVRALFDSFVNSGFSEDQAFTLLTLSMQNAANSSSSRTTYTYRPYKR